VFGVVENRIGDAPNLYFKSDVQLEAGVETSLGVRATVQRVAFFRAEGNGELHISVPYRLSSTVIEGRHRWSIWGSSNTCGGRIGRVLSASPSAKRERNPSDIPRKRMREPREIYSS